MKIRLQNRKKPPKHRVSKKAATRAVVPIAEVSTDPIGDERRRIVRAVRVVAAGAVPKETLDYLRGFQDGANFVAENVLGCMVIDERKTAI